MTTTQRFHRQRHITKTADPRVTRTEWTVAIASLVGAGYGYLNADDLAARSADMSSMPSTADDYRNYAVALAVMGIAAATVGTVDAIRASDDEIDDGVIRGDTEREERACSQRITRDRDVALILQSGQTLSAHLDGKGRAEFTMAPIAGEDIPAADGAVTVVVGDRHVQVPLTAQDWEELRNALEKDPHSRLAMDMLAKQQASCDRLTADARAATRDRFDAAPADAHAAWVAAKGGCERLWTVELETESAAVEARIEARRCTDELVALSASVDAETSPDALPSLAERLVEVRASCTSAPNIASEREIEAKLVGVSRRIHAEQEKEARRIAREEAQQRLQERRQQEREAARQRNWDGAMLLCNDGSLSPTCTCGRGSYGGCCSHHGGVNRCSAE